MKYYFNNRKIHQSKFVNEVRDWTPSDIGSDLSLWLDANDSATVISNGSGVSQWNDKSGNNRHVTQSIAEKQPIFRLNGINNLNSIEWNTVGQTLNIPSGIAITENMMVLSVMNRLSINQNNIDIASNRINNTPFGTWWGSTNFLNGGLGSSAAVNFGNNTSTGNFIFSSNRTTDICQMWVNGSQFSSNKTALTVGSLLETIGYRPGANQTNNGFIGEILVLPIFNNSIREKLEGYLAHKWGLADSLPLNHPYKDIHPKVIEYTNINKTIYPLFPETLGDALVLWLEANDASTITLNGSSISKWDDKSGNDYHATQAIAANQPTYPAEQDRVIFNTTDRLLTTLPATTGTLVLGTTNGTAAYGVNISAGSYDIGRRGGNYMPDGTAYGYILSNTAMSQEDIDAAIAYLRGKGAGQNYGNVTSFTAYWRGWSELTSFPLIDTSAGTNFLAAWHSCSSLASFPLINTGAGTNFQAAWQNCSSLTSFPLIDTSAGTNFVAAWQSCSNLTSFPLIDTSAGTSFAYAWFGCSSLTSFPSNFFSGCLATNFSNAFTSTNLSQQSIDNILVSIESNNTSNGKFNQSGGSAPSAVGEAAIDALVARGWTVTVTGGYQPSTAWSPSDLGSALALWLDADDADSVTLNGSSVSQWSDKSGTGNHMTQTTASNQPTYQPTGFNGKPTVFFDNVDDFMGNAAPANMTPNGDFFFAAVWEFAPLSNQWNMVMGFRPIFEGDSRAGDGMPILQRMRGDNQIGIHNTDLQDRRIKVDVAALSVKRIATVGRTGGTNGNGGTVTVTATGNSQISYATTATQTWESLTTGNDVFQISGRQQRNTNVGRGTGYFSELIAMGRNASTDERQRVEGYLAHKWGLTANLPSDHPYKNSAP